MADFVFAFDPALDRPLPRLDAAPPQVADLVAAAPQESLEAAVAAAIHAHASVFVMFGRVLDPQRASPAQAAGLRSLIMRLHGHGCRTAWLVADSAASEIMATMLGSPPGLVFVTPQKPLHLDLRGLDVELVAVGGFETLPHPQNTSPYPQRSRRIVVGWDSRHWNAERWDGDDVPEEAVHMVAPTWAAAASFSLWGTRRRQSPIVGVHRLPALQPRAAHEATPGCCGMLTLLEHPPADDIAAIGERRDQHESRSDWRHNWREEPTQRVVWHTLAIASATGGDEELATSIWSAIEGLAPPPLGPLQIVRCHVECGTSIARRVRVAEIAAETLARLRQLYDARSFRTWCQELVADPSESLVALGHTRSGARPGSTSSFSTALADICNRTEQQHAPGAPPDLVREAAWLALELIEST